MSSVIFSDPSMQIIFAYFCWLNCRKLNQIQNSRLDPAELLSLAKKSYRYPMKPNDDLLLLPFSLYQIHEINVHQMTRFA